MAGSESRSNGEYTPVDVEVNVPVRHTTSATWHPVVPLIAVALAMIVAFFFGSAMTMWPCPTATDSYSGPIREEAKTDAFVKVTVDPTTVVNFASGENHGYGCVTLDFWPSSKCDYGRCSWINSSTLTLPLDETGAAATKTHVLVRKALKALSKSHFSLSSTTPVILRLGGSPADLVRYDVPTPTGVPWNCTDFERDVSQPIGYKDEENGGPCMSMPRWDALNSLCKEGTCELVFNINGLYGRRKVPCNEETVCSVDEVHHDDMPDCCTSYDGEWDSSNAEALFRYTKEKGYKVWGFEFGNELAGFGGVQARLDVTTYVRGFCDLRSAVNRVWGDQDAPTRPKLIAPDSDIEADEAWFADFLTKSAAAGCPPDVVTWHQYLLGAGVDPNVGERCTSPSTLDLQKGIGDNVKNIIHDSVDTSSPPKIELWMGETGGAYNSGRHTVTDAFYSSFWYLSSMGMLAARGHQAFCRQTLVGGNYGVLNTTTYQPFPDYYALLLFHKLMGPQVLRTFETSGMHARYLQAFVHCSRGSSADESVTILLINLSKKKIFHVDVQGLPGGDFGTLDWMSWVMSAESLSSQQVSLNGGPPLRTSETGEIPMLNGVPSLVPAAGRKTPFFTVQPHTYAFVRLDGANARDACGKDVDNHS